MSSFKLKLGIKTKEKKTNKTRQTGMSFFSIQYIVINALRNYGM